MYYSVRHTTRFRYSMPIRESVMEVHMQPRRDGEQHCLSFELSTTPKARITATRDYLGNIVHHFDIPGEHTELTITAQSTVSIVPRTLPPSLAANTWAELDALVADGDFTEALMPSHFARPSALLVALGDEMGVRRRDDPLRLLRELNSRLHATLTYLPHSTRVDSQIDDALKLRSGVCQDYAHIMIALVRGLGIPCRYVSGYLYRTIAGADRVGADATHAWVEALLPGLGWIGFDPTNNAVAGERHIRVAVGRDYADVPPTRGVYKGKAVTDLGVGVQISLADEPPSDDELLLVMRRLPADDEGHQPEQQQQTSELMHGRVATLQATRVTKKGSL
ncbi:MAG: transglutaminase family protein [Herpetosiphon sp.]